MNCHDLERIWMARLDAGATSPNLVENGEAAEHLVACPACQSRVEGFLALELATTRPSESPTLTPLEVERLVRMVEQEQDRQRRLQPVRVLFWVSGVAAALIVGSVFMRNRPVPLRNRAHTETVLAPDQSAQRLPEALAQATTATLQLARSSSSPAARLGALVFESTSVPSPEIPNGLEVQLSPSEGVLESVGSGLGTGMQPFAGSARRAFGFLLGPVDGSGKPQG
jgi:hypothetical protein